MAIDPPEAPALFGSRSPEPAPRSLLPWILAAAVVLLVGGLILVAGHRKPATALNILLPPDQYATHVTFTGLVMSESTSLSGGKSTYIDGHIRNIGDRTITAATLQVLFANDDAMPPQVETVPVALIRTREPYVDTQPVSAAPLAPGDDREFRLIFEDIGSNWNQRAPEIHLVHATLR